MRFLNYLCISLNCKYYLSLFIVWPVYVILRHHQPSIWRCRQIRVSIRPSLLIYYYITSQRSQIIFFWGFSVASGSVYDVVSTVSNSGIYMNFAKVNIIYEQEHSVHSTSKNMYSNATFLLLVFHYCIYLGMISCMWPRNYVFVFKIIGCHALSLPPLSCFPTPPWNTLISSKRHCPPTSLLLICWALFCFSFHSYPTWFRSKSRLTWVNHGDAVLMILLRCLENILWYFWERSLW